VAKSRYELSISPDYVKDWGVWAGVRELLQNMIDQSPEEGRIFRYDSSGQLVIGNKNTKLDRSSLLLGNTKKPSIKNRPQIGKFGEGYKLAFLALMRHGIRVEVQNSGEVWTPKFLKSKRYGSEILVVDVEKGEKSSDLLFVLTGVRPEHYSEIVNNYLGLCRPENIIQGDSGRVLLDEKFKGRVFVAGLYVCTLNSARYGYDMNPGHIELDRDRAKVSDFNLFWETSRLYAKLSDRTFANIIHEMMEAKAPDVEYYHSFMDPSFPKELFKDVCELSYKAFLTKHGKNAVACRDEATAKLIRERYNSLVPVVVAEVQWKFISGSISHVGSGRAALLEKASNDNTPYRFIEKFLASHKHEIFGKARKAIEEEVLPETRNWMYR